MADQNFRVKSGLTVGIGGSIINTSIDGNVGVGTTTPTSKLWVNGSGYFIGSVTSAQGLYVNGELVGSGAISGGNIVGSALSISGISTLGTVEISSGIITATTGVATFFGNFIGTASTASFATTAFNLDATAASNLNVAYALSAGISTNVIGGIASVTSLFVNEIGISTLGTVEISSGIITATTGVATFFGNFIGTASTASFATTAFNLDATAASNLNVAYASTAGYATTAFNLDATAASNLNVAYASTAGIASAVKPNSVGLGTDTFGDYVKSISGISNEIEITVLGGTGESSTPTVGFAPNPTIGGNVTIGNDLQVNNNLNVTGNITIGGTTGYVLVENFRVSDADIILGFTTDSQNNESSNDTTANHGGIAVASTEGNPLVSLNIVGIETLPATYKKIMWFKAGAFAGLNTDAWLSNYAIGIGSTQFPVGTRLAAGNVQFTQNDLAVVRNINATGIVTADEFSGKLNATSALAQSVGFATTATNLAGGNSGNIPYQSATNTTAFVTNGTIGQVLISNGSDIPQWGNVSAASGSFGGITVRDEGTQVGTGDSITTLNFVGSNIQATATTGSNGIATITMSDNLVGSGLSISGISTLGTVEISSGIITSSIVGSSVTYYGDGSKLTGVSGVQVELQDLVGDPVYLTLANNSGVSSIGIVTSGDNALVLIPSNGRLGIGTTNPTSKLWVNGDGYFVGVVTSAGFYVDGSLIGNGSVTVGPIVGTALSISGVSTLGTVEVSSGIVTATTGIVTFYGDFVGTASSAGYASTAGIATYTSEWILGANGISDYTFTGPGFIAATNDPILYLIRGQQYKFTNTMGAHPFRIQSTVNGSTGTQYNIGIVNNDVSNGTLTWDVQFDSPSILYYQCTAHGSMGGKIYIIDAGIGSDISINTTGIITANSFRGDGSQLSGLIAGVSISTNTTNQSQFIPYVTGTGSTTGFGVTTTGLVFNPSSNSLGIGTTNPTSKLTVQGNVLISGVTTSGITRISSSTASPNASTPVATLEAVGSSTNYDIAIVPKGNGAIVANIPDGTSVGGNKRGTYAVDLQLSRSTATHVASGENSFIGNGHRNTASGNYSVVLSGSVNTSSSLYSVISGGNYNTASGEKSFVGNGESNSASGNFSSIVNGEGNHTQTSDHSIIAGGSWNNIYGSHTSILCASYSITRKNYSSVINGYWGDTRNTYGAVVFSGANSSFGSGFFPGGGYQQSRLAILSKETTDATLSTLTADGNAYDTSNVLQVVEKSAYLVKGSVIAYSNASDIARAWEFTAAIKNTSGTPTLVGTPIINDIAYDSGASGWSLSITADAGTSSLKVEVTGQASTTIRWVTKIDSTEVAFQ